MGPWQHRPHPSLQKGCATRTPNDQHQSLGITSPKQPLHGQLYQKLGLAGTRTARHTGRADQVAEAYL